MIKLGLLIWCFLGGLFARMDGGGKPKTPEWVERTLCMACFVAACVPFAGWWSLVAYLGVAGIATGHGQYFLARDKKKIEPEFFDFIVTWVFGKDWRTTPDFHPDADYADIYDKLYWRCIFGMFVTGTVVGLPAALLAAYYGEWFAVLMFSLTGLIKATVYPVMWKLFKSTEPAEWGNGTLRTAAALVVLSTFVLN